MISQLHPCRDHLADTAILAEKALDCFHDKTNAQNLAVRVPKWGHMNGILGIEASERGLRRKPFRNPEFEFLLSSGL